MLHRTVARTQHVGYTQAVTIEQCVCLDIRLSCIIPLMLLPVIVFVHLPLLSSSPSSSHSTTPPSPLSSFIPFFTSQKF
jgi:hypothetical protein